MTITELAILKLLENPTNYGPFVFQYRFYDYTVAPYWTDIFGAPDESTSRRIYINEVTRDYGNKYDVKYSLSDCLSNEKSFYFDVSNQILSVHIEHDQAPWTCILQYGEVYGLADQLVYIDEVYYAPLLLSIPSLAQQQDLINYDKLFLITGSILYDNTEGLLDEFIDTKLFGNTIDIYYLDIDNIDETTREATRSNMQQLARVLVDDYGFALDQFDVRVTDLREEWDANIPTEVFTEDDYPDINEDYIGEIIPDMYGLIRASTAIPTDGDATGTVSFRQALVLTTLGTVQVLIDDVWTTKVPTASDLSTGSFTLAQADGRKDGAADGDPYECRVLNSIGQIITFGSDPIKLWNDTYLNIEYNSSNYDTTEWESEETELSTVGILLDEQKKLTEWIRILQDGADKGFRYEINARGLRTIRINNWERTVAWNIHYSDIKNQLTQSVVSDKEYLAANLKVQYAKDYNSGKYLNFLNEDYAEYVLQNYRTKNTVAIEKLLTTELLASNFSDWYLEKFSDIPRIADLQVLGSDFLSVRIYDTAYIDISTGQLDIEENVPEREYFGRWLCQILSIDPKIDDGQNNITALLIEKIEITTPVIRITEDNKMRLTENGNIRILE